MLGTIIYGTLGCVLFFGIFGNYAVYLQISGQFNVTQYLNTHGTEATIIEVVHHLPFPSLMIVFLVSAFLFLATTFDSGSYILAAASQKKVVGEPLRANRLFWAFALCLFAIFIDASWWRTCIGRSENCFNTGKCAINCYFYFHDDIIFNHFRAR